LEDVLLKHVLDTIVTNVKKELDRELTTIDRIIPSFEDFAPKGK